MHPRASGGRGCGDACGGILTVSRGALAVPRSAIALVQAGTTCSCRTGGGRSHAAGRRRTAIKGLVRGRLVQMALTARGHGRCSLIEK